MHHAHQCLHHSDVTLILEVSLVVLAVEKQMLEKLLEQRHREHIVIQVGILAQRLLKVPHQGEAVGRIDLSGELKHGLQLYDQAGEVKSVQVLH